jgi:long-chain acyl-CoA synthetase
VNITSALIHFGMTRPEAAALIEGDRSLTYSQLSERIRCTATHLAKLGIRRGERVGVCMGDNSRHLIALFAVAYYGAVAVPLDWRSPPPELTRLIAGLGLAAMLVEPGAREVEGARNIPVDTEWHEAVGRAPAMDEACADWYDPFVISATSGSTGAPKLTVMTHAQYYFATVAMWELVGLAGHQRFLCNLPLYYSGGRNSCIAHLLRGDSVVMSSNLFTAGEYVALLAREAITTAAVVPAMVRQLLPLTAGREEPLLPCLEALFSIGAPLYAPEKLQALRALTPRFHERYGTAETLAISVLRPQDMLVRPDSVGQPHSLAQVQVVDRDHRPLPGGAAGQLRLRAPGMGSPLPDSAAEANFRDGWFYPGEIGHVDSRGYIFLEGRTSDVIMRSGAKIHPAEVERVLLQHEDVLEAAVLGQGAGNDEEVIAFVVTHGDVGSGELLAHCRVNLSPHKVPRAIRFITELPRNTAGKIDKQRLAAGLAVAPVGHSGEALPGLSAPEHTVEIVDRRLQADFDSH